MGLKTACTGLLFGLGLGLANAQDLSGPADHLRQWIVRDADNQGMPFVILDKRAARLWLFDGEGRFVTDSAVLLGSAVGDTSAPDIGTRPLARIEAHERTTPAGRFVIEPGENLKGEDILWIDYHAAVSMHRVRSAHPGERRLERLASATPRDNRISYGCVNVPVAFYERELRPRFAKRRGLAYVLPEQLGLQEAFPRFKRARWETPAPPPR